MTLSKALTKAVSNAPPLAAVAVATAVACLATVPPAAASTFTIAPIRADLSAAHRTQALTLLNVEDDPVVVQVRAEEWSQVDGQEHLVDTHELLATPPVLQIAPKGQQVVRVALRREPDGARELSYRIIFEEVPQAVVTNFNGLRVSLQLSVPVFVAPLHGKPMPDVRWTVHRAVGGELEVVARNAGTRHLQVTDFDLQPAGANQPAGTAQAVHGLASRYVLPGSQIEWPLKTAVDLLEQGPLVIQGHSDQGNFTADVAFSDR